MDKDHQYGLEHGLSVQYLHQISSVQYLWFRAEQKHPFIITQYISQVLNLGAIPDILIPNPKSCMRHGGRENYILTQILPLAMTFLKCVALLLNCVQLFCTLWTVAHQTPLFIEFPRQEY